MQHRLHWGRSEDTTFPRLCQPRSKVPHPTMGDTCNHAPTTHMTHQTIHSSNPFNCPKSHEGQNWARRDRLLPVTARLLHQSRDGVGQKSCVVSRLPSPCVLLGARLDKRGQTGCWERSWQHTINCCSTTQCLSCGNCSCSCHPNFAQCSYSHYQGATCFRLIQDINTLSADHRIATVGNTIIFLNAGVSIIVARSSAMNYWFFSAELCKWGR